MTFQSPEEIQKKRFGFLKVASLRLSEFSEQMLQPVMVGLEIGGNKFVFHFQSLFCHKLFVTGWF